MHSLRKLMLQMDALSVDAVMRFLYSASFRCVGWFYRTRLSYSLLQLTLLISISAANAQEANVAQKDANQIRQLAARGMITNPGGVPQG